MSRPLSSVNPTMVFKGGELELVTGPQAVAHHFRLCFRSKRDLCLSYGRFRSGLASSPYVERRHGEKRGLCAYRPEVRDPKLQNGRK